MKSFKVIALALSIFSSLAVASAEGLVTLTCQGSVSASGTNEVQIAANQQVTIKTFLDGIGVNEAYLPSAYSRVEIVKDGKTIIVKPVVTQIEQNGATVARFSPWLSGAISIAGPATIRVVCPSASSSAMLTLDITPSQYPPDRAVTVGPYSADMKVTMEMSTDLVNWTVAQNAAVYTNTPEARFFRIKLEKNIPAP